MHSHKFRSLPAPIHQVPACHHAPFLRLYHYICMSLSMPTSLPSAMPMPSYACSDACAHATCPCLCPCAMPNASAYAHDISPLAFRLSLSSLLTLLQIAIYELLAIRYLSISNLAYLIFTVQYFDCKHSYRITTASARSTNSDEFFIQILFCSPHKPSRTNKI